MFERFTERSRRIVVLAQEYSRSLQNDFIAPSHIILGILHEDDCYGAQALSQSGLSYDFVYTTLDEVYTKSTNDTLATLHIPFTVAGQKLIELCLREALQLGHNYIGTEHLVLAWIRLTDKTFSAATLDEADTKILLKTEMNAQQLRSQVITVISRINARESLPSERSQFPQVDARADISIDVEIPLVLQKALVDSKNRLLAFLEVSDQDPTINPSIRVVFSKLRYTDAHVRLQLSEIRTFCSWYRTYFSHLVLSDHPFKQLYELFINTIHPELHG